ncbi:MAG TPA: dTDP-4-dehydrorhamnose 3,5-epimerase [Bacilli bacterium]|nr:dTDP-4-dehydrorhamnose 3,5-epimerase [Bacilli bacterium]
MIQKWVFEKLPLEGAYKISPFCATDNRGLLCKDYSKEIFEQNGISYDLKETFYTKSFKGVIRALHFQVIKEQPKLMRCIQGHVFHVIVDLRPDSKTFKQWMSFDLSGDNFTEILVPAGFANGYLALEDSIMAYKCSEKFYGEYDGGIKWDDPTIGVSWPLEQIGGKDRLILAEKDMQLPSFLQFFESSNLKD